MIVTLAHNIQSQINCRNELEQIRDNKKNIADTYQVLEEVSALLSQAITSFNLIKPLLTDEQVAQIIAEIQAIDKRLKTSHTKFTTKHRQVKELNSLKTLVQNLNKSLERGWYSYASAKTYPHFELLKLVEQLPEVTEQITTIAPLQKKLQSAPGKLPRRTSDLDQFKKELQLLQDSLVNLSTLNSEVTQFLRKVQKGSASIADLTDDVLAWCRENERAATFKINFGQNK